MSSDERREHPRLVLSVEDGYFGNFKLPNQENLIAPILNISAGGLKMVVANDARMKIKDGDVLMLQNIAGGTRLAFLSDIKAEIRWIKDESGKIHVGCQFGDLAEGVLLQLKKFVATERMARGQYD